MMIVVYGIPLWERYVLGQFCLRFPYASPQSFKMSIFMWFLRLIRTLSGHPQVVLNLGELNDSHESRISCLGLSADGSALCTGSWDRKLKVSICCMAMKLSSYLHDMNLLMIANLGFFIFFCNSLILPVVSDLGFRGWEKNYLMVVHDIFSSMVVVDRLSSWFLSLQGPAIIVVFISLFVNYTSYCRSMAFWFPLASSFLFFEGTSNLNYLSSNYQAFNQLNLKLVCLYSVCSAVYSKLHYYFMSDECTSFHLYKYRHDLIFLDFSLDCSKQYIRLGEMLLFSLCLVLSR